MSFLRPYRDIKFFFTKRAIPWQDKAIALVTALSFSLAIILKERGALLGVLFIPLLLFYPYSARDKKNIIKQYASPLYLLFYALLAVFAFSILWGGNHNTIMPHDDYRRVIFYHGWWVVGRLLLLAAIVAPLLWFFNAKPMARDATMQLLMMVGIGTMLLIIVLTQLGLINNGARNVFRNDQYSQNVAILFLLILPLVFKKNMLAWLCLPLIFLLHLPMMTISGFVVGYGTARLWTVAIFMGGAMYLLLPWLLSWKKNSRIFLWGLLLLGYLLVIITLLASGLIFKPNDPYNHPLLQFLKSIDIDGHSIKERFKFWHFISYYILQHPWVGYGLNITRYLPTLSNDFMTTIFSIPYHAIKGECFLMNGWCEALNQPHYIWIEILLDAGVLAPLLLFSFFAVGWWQLMVKHNRHPATRGALAFFTACAFCFILTNSFYAFWQTYMMAVAMVLLLSQVAKNKKS